MEISRISNKRKVEIKSGGSIGPSDQAQYVVDYTFHRISSLKKIGKKYKIFLLNIFSKFLTVSITLLKHASIISIVYM